MMWESFLHSWNGRNFFLQDELTAAPDLLFYTDASDMLGYGAYFHPEWFRGDWNPRRRTVSIYTSYEIS